MKWVVGLLMIGHGAIHAIGVASALAPTRFPFQRSVSPPSGAAWAAAALLLLTAAVLLIAGWRLWWLPAMAGVVLSQVLVVMWWPDAKFGTVANVLIAVAIAVTALGDRPASNGEMIERFVARRERARWPYRRRRRMPFASQATTDASRRPAYEVMRCTEAEPHHDRT